MFETDFHQFPFSRTQQSIRTVALSFQVGSHAGILPIIVWGGRKEEMDTSSSLCLRAEGSLHTLSYLGKGKHCLSLWGPFGYTQGYEALKTTEVLTDPLKVYSE